MYNNVIIIIVNDIKLNIPKLFSLVYATNNVMI